jgi:hypothetical protein
MGLLFSAGALNMGQLLSIDWGGAHDDMGLLFSAGARIEKLGFALVSLLFTAGVRSKWRPAMIVEVVSSV